MGYEQVRQARKQIYDHQAPDSRINPAAYRGKNKESKNTTKTEKGYKQSDSTNKQVIVMSIPIQTMSRN